VRIQGVDRHPGHTGRRPRSVLRWIRSLSCAGTYQRKCCFSFLGTWWDGRQGLWHWGFGSRLSEVLRYPGSAFYFQTSTVFAV
jgi:hypothetical protein